MGTIRLAFIAFFLGITVTVARGENLPSIEAFFRRTDIMSPAVSPDGAHLAYFVEQKGKRLAVVLNLATGAVERAWPAENGEKLAWKGNERFVINGRLIVPLVINIRTHALQRIEAREGLDVIGILDYLRDFPDLLLVHRRKHIALLNLNNGHEEVLLESPPDQPYGAGRRSRGYVFDQQGVLRVYLDREKDDMRLMVRRDGEKDFLPAKTSHLPDVPWQPIRLTEDGTKLFIIDLETAEFAQPALYDLRSGTLAPLAGAPAGVETRDIVFMPRSSTVLGVVALGADYRTRWIDERWQKIQAALESAFPRRDVSIADYSDDMQTCLISVSSTREAGDWYVWHRQKQDLRVVARWIPPMPLDRLAATQAVDIPTRDGATIHGYLTKAKKDSAVAGPLILKPLSSPFDSRTQLAYDQEVQLLASRGYSVLGVDYRGAAGYGQGYRSAGYGQLAGRVVDDVNDAARWAIAQGHAQTGAVALYGQEIAGGIALLAAQRDQAPYRCVIIRNATTDWKKLAADKVESARFWYETGGNQGENITPGEAAGNLTIPVLEVERNEDNRDPALRGAARKNKRYSVAKFLTTNEYHSDFEYRMHEVNSLMKFLEDKLPVSLLPAK